MMESKLQEKREIPQGLLTRLRLDLDESKYEELSNDDQMVHFDILIGEPGKRNILKIVSDDSKNIVTYTTRLLLSLTASYNIGEERYLGYTIDDATTGSIDLVGKVAHVYEDEDGVVIALEEVDINGLADVMGCKELAEGYPRIGFEVKKKFKLIECEFTITPKLGDYPRVLYTYRIKDNLEGFEDVKRIYRYLNRNKEALGFLLDEEYKEVPKAIYTVAGLEILRWNTELQQFTILKADIYEGKVYPGEYKFEESFDKYINQELTFDTTPAPPFIIKEGIVMNNNLCKLDDVNGELASDIFKFVQLANNANTLNDAVRDVKKNEEIFMTLSPLFKVEYDKFVDNNLFNDSLIFSNGYVLNTRSMMNNCRAILENTEGIMNKVFNTSIETLLADMKKKEETVDHVEAEIIDEDQEIADMIEEREAQDDGTRYTVEEIKERRIENKKDNLSE